jgi:hypothetical protein
MGDVPRDKNQLAQVVRGKDLALRLVPVFHTQYSNTPLLRFPLQDRAVYFIFT